MIWNPIFSVFSIVCHQVFDGLSNLFALRCLTVHWCLVLCSNVYTLSIHNTPLIYLYVFLAERYYITFGYCHRISVCPLFVSSVGCRLHCWCKLLRGLSFSAIFNITKV